jgi:hypothetical protein
MLGHSMIVGELALQIVSLAAAAAAGYSFARMREAKRNADAYQRAADLLAKWARVMDQRREKAPWN